MTDDFEDRWIDAMRQIDPDDVEELKLRGERSTSVVAVALYAPVPDALELVEYARAAGEGDIEAGFRLTSFAWTIAQIMERIMTERGIL